MAGVARAGIWLGNFPSGRSVGLVGQIVQSKYFGGARYAAPLAIATWFGVGCGGRYTEGLPNADTGNTGKTATGAESAGGGATSVSGGMAAGNGVTAGNAMAGNAAVSTTGGTATTLGGGGTGAGAPPGSVTAGGGTVYVGAGRLATVLAQGLKRPTALVVYGGKLYFADFGTDYYDGSVWALPVDTSGPLVPVAQAQRGPDGLAVDATGVYWSAQAWMRASLDGTNQTQLATGTVNGPIAVGPSGIYGTGSVAGSLTTLVRVPLVGGSLSALAPPSSLGRSMQSYGFALDATSVYWTTFDDPTSIKKMPLEGDTAQTLATTPGAGGGIVLHGGNAYWVASSAVMSVPTAGGTAVVLAPSSTTLAGGDNIAVDDANVYWTTTNSVMKASLAGGPAEVLASDLPAPAPIAVDATSVYWGTTSTFHGLAAGTIVKLTPK